jgi:hypothetical protein
LESVAYMLIYFLKGRRLLAWGTGGGRMERENA